MTGIDNWTTYKALAIIATITREPVAITQVLGLETIVFLASIATVYAITQINNFDFMTFRSACDRSRKKDICCVFRVLNTLQQSA